MLSIRGNKFWNVKWLSFSDARSYHRREWVWWCELISASLVIADERKDFKKIKSERTEPVWSIFCRFVQLLWSHSFVLYVKNQMMFVIFKRLTKLPALFNSVWTAYLTPSTAKRYSNDVGSLGLLLCWFVLYLSYQAIVCHVIKVSKYP